MLLDMSYVWMVLPRLICDFVHGSELGCHSEFNMQRLPHPVMGSFAQRKDIPPLS